MPQPPDHDPLPPSVRRFAPWTWNRWARWALLVLAALLVCAELPVFAFCLMANNVPGGEWMFYGGCAPMLWLADRFPPLAMFYRMQWKLILLAS
ncbi:MAG: hypothetical protein SH850_22715 [Planctomycetaceae bacterium]|nr:hypothetical protein [Planctomycetaceae bacterium]